MARKVAKYFSDTTELVDARSMVNPEFAQRFPGIKGLWYDSFHRWVGTTTDAPKTLLPVTRKIFYSTTPSLHVCSGKCRSATGPNCECACGGQYHGAN
jgi:hypothetical protein